MNAAMTCPAPKAECTLVSRRVHSESTVVDCRGVKIGGPEIVVIAGPCAVEGLEMLRQTAMAVKGAGGSILRGGAFKPRSSPYSFQGLGKQGLEYLAQVRDEIGLPIVTEVLASSEVELVATYADMLQVGARNMQNYELLREIGRQRKPVLLKRGFSASIDEWLQSAEYILAHGNTEVILCERGIRTFETRTRFTLDLSAIPLVKSLTHLPVLVDPSHSTGIRDLVIPMSLAAIAAGADGIIIETHPTPDTALCDGAQSLRFPQLLELRAGLAEISRAVGRRINTE